MVGTPSPEGAGDRIRRQVSDGSVILPGVWDPWSAIVAARAGFETLFLGGYAVSASLLGVPDIGLLTQTEMADVARRVCAAVRSTAVIVDADTGYGGVSNVIRTVELWAAAGAAGLVVEDQVWPKRCGHMVGKRVVERDDWLDKLRAVVTRADGMYVVARTDARAVVSLDEAIERARMASDLGVDAVFVEAPESISELERIAASVDRVALVANMVEGGRTPLLGRVELSDLGFRLVLAPVAGLFGATRALHDTFATLRDEGTMRAALDRLAGFDEFADIVDLAGHVDAAARHMRANLSDRTHHE